MARIKENPHEIMVLFWSILRINVLKRTKIINQCKKIDIKVIPPSHRNNTTNACTDAFVTLHFYQGHHDVPSKRKQESKFFIKNREFCTYIDFACLHYYNYAMTVWYRINCSESQLLSFVVDSKVSYSVGDQNLIFPRNIDFEIVHKIDNKNLYRGSSDFIGVTISDTTECFNPIINFAKKAKISKILVEDKKYSLFESSDVTKNTRSYYSIYDKPENLTWNMAAKFCQSQGLHLLTIADAKEEKEVLSLLSQKSPGRSEMSVSIYLGLIARRQVYPSFCHPCMRTGNTFTQVCLCVCIYLSVCLCVCVNFELLWLGTSFSVCRYILTISRSSLIIKVIWSRSRSNVFFVIFYLAFNIMCLYSI